MNNKSKLNIVFGILVLAALVGGLVLVRQNQNTQRGAYFAGTKVLVMPESISANTGSKAVAQLYLETADSAKVSSIDTVVCYGNGLSLAEGSLSSQVVLNNDALKDLVDTSLVTVDGRPCVRIVGLAGATMKPSDLKSGMFKVVDIKFDTTAEATGKISVIANKTKVGGYNPAAGATDNSLQVTSTSEANYTVSGGVGSCGWCGLTCRIITEGLQCPAVASPADKECVSANNSCEVRDTSTAMCNTLYYYNTETKRCVATSNKYNSNQMDCNNTAVSCAQNLESYVTGKTTGVCYSSQSTCESANSSASGDDAYLKFRMAFYGIRGDAMCADGAKMPLTVTVRAADGTAKTYSDVVPTRVNSSGDLALYDVSLRLAGFTYKNNISVFVKGPKSLQVKYGKNNQSDYYGVAGGELSGLTSSESTTPTFDFSKYPLLAGDVTGSSGTQDGVVDGLDFSYIKTESVKRTEVETHGYMTADTNGNCKMESQDVANMMLSLSVKQGQLY